MHTNIAADTKPAFIPTSIPTSKPAYSGRNNHSQRICNRSGHRHRHKHRHDTDTNIGIDIDIDADTEKSIGIDIDTNIDTDADADTSSTSSTAATAPSKPLAMSVLDVIKPANYAICMQSWRQPTSRECSFGDVELELMT